MRKLLASVWEEVALSVDLAVMSRVIDVDTHRGRTEEGLVSRSSMSVSPCAASRS